MAAKYSPYRIIQLLQVSAWRCNTTLDYTGFSSLSEAVTKHNLSNKKYPDIDQKYLNELLLSAKKAIETGNKFGKSEQHINALLNYNDCLNWKDFQEEAARVEQFLNISKIDFSKSVKEGITIVYENSIHPSLLPIISFIEKHTKLPVNVHAIDSSTDIDVVLKLDELVAQTPFVIWCISDQCIDRQLFSESPELERHISSGQLIPIRFSNVLSERHLKAPFLGTKPISSGVLGLYLSVALIHQGLEVFRTVSTIAEANNQAKGSSTFHIEKNSGTVFQVDKVKGGNITLGGNFIQNIQTKKKKKKS